MATDISVMMIAFIVCQLTDQKLRAKASVTAAPIAPAMMKQMKSFILLLQSAGCAAVAFQSCSSAMHSGASLAGRVPLQS